MENKISFEDIERRLVALERTVASLTAEKKPHEEAISFEHLGGKNVGHHVRVKAGKEISFEHLGGKKVGHFKHDAPEEKDDEARTD